MKKEYREIVTFRRERPSDRAVTKQLNMPPDMVSGDNATSVAFLPKKMCCSFKKIHFIHLHECEFICEYMHTCVLICVPIHGQRPEEGSRSLRGRYRYLQDVGSELQSHNYSAKILNC